MVASFAVDWRLRNRCVATLGSARAKGIWQLSRNSELHHARLALRLCTLDGRQPRLHGVSDGESSLGREMGPGSAQNPGSWQPGIPSDVHFGSACSFLRPHALSMDATEHRQFGRGSKTGCPAQAAPIAEPALLLCAV